jgi:hypothetical protein
MLDYSKRSKVVILAEVMLTSLSLFFVYFVRLFRKFKTPINCEVQPKDIHHAPKPKRSISNMNSTLNRPELLSTPPSETSLFFPNLSSLTSETANAQQESRDQQETKEQTSFSPVVGTSLLHQNSADAAQFFKALPQEVKKLEKTKGTSLISLLNTEETVNNKE